MIITQTEQSRNRASIVPARSGARLRRRLLSGGCVATAQAHAAKTAAFSGFLSDTCLSVAHIPPSTSPDELGPPAEGPADLLGALNLLGAPHMLPPPAGEAPLSPPRKRKGGYPAVAAKPGHVNCCLPPACQHLSLIPLPASAVSEQEGAAFSREVTQRVSMPVDASSPTAAPKQLPASPRPTKRGPLITPRLLQLPLPGANGSSKSRRKPQLLSPACGVLDVTSSPLSVISQASTTCALLSSASSLASCSQPATPNCLVLGSPLPSGPHSPLPLTPPSQSPTPQTPTETTSTAPCDRAPQSGVQGATVGPRLRARAVCNYDVQIFRDPETQPEQQGVEPAVTATVAAGLGSAAAAPAPPSRVAGDAPSATEKGLLQLPAVATPPADESTVATSFLSSPTTTASASPLRLPIPTRGMRRLQHPRLQQQAVAAPSAAAEEAEATTIHNAPRSLRRLQLPRLRATPLSDDLPVSMLRGHDAERGECNTGMQRHVGNSQNPTIGTPECMYSPAEDSLTSAGAATDCASCSGSCSRGAAAVPRGGPLGDAFEAAAHAAHVAARAAARAAAYAAAHAAVLQRRAVEAYWSTRSASPPTFSVYPDLDRDIHLDYNLFCAAWPDAAAPLSARSTEDSDSMAVDAAPPIGPLPARAEKNQKATHGHLVLGEGRYGKVVLAEHKRTHEMVAVKMLDKRRALAEDAWDCRQELEMHRRLPHHAHVVSVLDVYEDRKSLYILMELCDRNTLVDRIVSDGAFTEEQAKIIFAQLLSGVMHCHNNNIVHRDLKPENILFAREIDDPRYLASSNRSMSSSRRSSADHRPYPSFPNTFEPQFSSSATTRASSPTVKITDFGSACYAVPGELSGTACGTIHYLAPEVLAGNYYDGFLSDVWSLGVILYIIISATPPFYGESDGEVVQKIIAGSYSMNGYQWRHVSDECKDIIRRLLTVDPRCRMSLNAAISHPWFIRATGGLGWPLSMHGCNRYSVEDSSYDGMVDEVPLDKDFQGPCYCGTCHGDRCEEAALALSPSCRFACCTSSPRAAPWVSARAGGFVDWPRN